MNKGIGNKNDNVSKFCRSPILRDSFLAFVTGGAICVFGELLKNLYLKLGAAEDVAPTLVSISLITLTALLTGIGVFDKIGKIAGAGVLVPITGFANSMVAPAIDNKSEGWILGVGANMFKIAGPVIAYGTISGVVYGLIYWITTVI